MTNWRTIADERLAAMHGVSVAEIRDELELRLAHATILQAVSPAARR